MACAIPFQSSSRGRWPVAMALRPGTSSLGLGRLFKLVNIVSVWSKTMQEIFSHSQESSSPFQELLFQERELRTREGMYSACQVMVRRMVYIAQSECKTREASIYWLRRRYGMRSIFKKLFYDEPYRIYGEEYFQLQDAFEHMVRASRLRAEHVERVAMEMRGANA